MIELSVPLIVTVWGVFQFEFVNVREVGLSVNLDNEEAFTVTLPVGGVVSDTATVLDAPSKMDFLVSETLINGTSISATLTTTSAVRPVNAVDSVD